jgi:hypothetical protein
MVDYSKWDKFNYDEDDDDDEDVEVRLTVKKIGGDKGGKVQIGPSGYSVANENGEEVDNFTAEHRKAPPANDERRVVTLNINCENGSTGCYRGTHYYWSQDRYEVILTLFVDWVEGMKKKDVAVSYFSGTKELTIAARRDSRGVAFKGNFQFGVEVTGDPENPYDEVFEWSVVPDMQHPTDGSRLYTAVQLVLKKASPLPNAIFWWKNVFVGEPHIDVTKIKGRASTASAAQDEFQQAQKIFFERLQQQQQQRGAGAGAGAGDQRIEVDIPDDDDDDEHDS